MESGGELYNTQMTQIIPANQAEKRLKVFNVDLGDVHKRNQEEKKLKNISTLINLAYIYI